MKNFLLSKPLSLDMFERVDPAADEDWKETRSVGLCGAKAHSAKMRNQRETRKELGEERIKKQSGEGIGRCIKGRENGQLGSRRDVSWNENEGTGARKIAALFREPEKSHQLFPQKYSRKGGLTNFQIIILPWREKRASRLVWDHGKPCETPERNLKSFKGWGNLRKWETRKVEKVSNDAKNEF